MTRYFYDCPIKAAYMVKYHGVKIHGPVRKSTNEINTSSLPLPVWILARAIEAAEKGMAPQDARYYVAEESLHLLKPQEHDVVLINDGEGANWLTWWKPELDAAMLISILKREGFAFIRRRSRAYEQQGQGGVREVYKSRISTV